MLDVISRTLARWSLVCGFVCFYNVLEGCTLKTLVIKFGGSIATDQTVKKNFYQDIVYLRHKGYRIVICHGGGPEINDFLKKLNIEPRFVHGLRVTDEQTMQIVEMVLSGKVNRELVGALNVAGAPAVGLSGKDAFLLVAKKIKTDPDLGFVGVVEKVNTKVLLDLLKDYVVVISSLGIDRKGRTFNINADNVATAVARALQASQLILLTNVKGVLSDPENPRSTIATMYAKHIDALIKKKVVFGGMIPKIKACKEALAHGVEEIDIVDGTISHVVRKAVEKKVELGTRFVKG